jgi:hypothetical protein
LEEKRGAISVFCKQSFSTVTSAVGKRECAKVQRYGRQRKTKEIQGGRKGEEKKRKMEGDHVFVLVSALSS